MTDGAVRTSRPVTPTTILGKELRELVEALDAGDVGEEFARRLRRARDLADGLDPYLDRHTTRESSALAELSRRTLGLDWDSRTVVSGSGPLEQEMLSGHVEGQALKFLVHMTRARRVLEIGMFTGYSALAMAEALPDGGEVVACEVDRFVADFARECFAQSPAGSRISVEVGPALETLHRLSGRFDLVFIDADKTGYLDYYRHLMDSDLLAPGAIVAVDNTLLQGTPYADAAYRTANGDAVEAFNTFVTEDPRVEQVLLPLRDGVTLIRRVEA
ncbi:class I SAM-dependent methyltransferase [Rhodococcus sp. BP-252]|uniref:O-methyltransferase n=1 Tax=unclassified Rhodococcus (in: high G+C Gram-positive bacteria) TaxID=192944 RepID=UPI0016AC6959|nr:MULTISPECIES: class I SAM-dependent methyltransferase [unclassified Rhodococcus (in: high G+C Gram-positive bacteria)]MBY6414537.1 class I SAM-dependent methyltransferase [Rhodococcus sp. BP-320]MBY6419554.1 class I SAM-dependent methyltransferase [Rhodococcus sp. BP-321]MBY6424204.1 class I SAM-dependent methyltransferase [Rhodococcus sp. BP-324]MBY6429539.1 class I SAM-dependent methyltransferase [Rhodococcus sp. BP-323]MBY6434396.1 class I SAM-dependent methyltransferase [Rhodococcus sp.